MRRYLLAVMVAVGVLSSGPIVSVVAAETQPADRFPLPADAVIQRTESKEPSKKKASGDSRITVYDVPRGRDAMVTEARAALDAGKWVVVKSEVSNGSVRLILRKDGRTWKAGFTGDDKRAVIIVTAPA
jgi:hypothetical protein